MPKAPHVLVNGLSIGGGGGYTVARELLRHMALARPAWRFTIVLIRDHPLHENFTSERLPDNCSILWAPASTRQRIKRLVFENFSLVKWCEREEATAVLQPNGMILPRLRLPTLSHNQDPWPYRPEAWFGGGERLLALLKRRAHRSAMRRADVYGWTSRYLEQLVCRWQGFTPRRSVVFHNGVPDEWIERSRAELPSWRDRPMEIVTLSEVDPYKRQSLVIQALPRLLAMPGMEEVRYRIVGGCRRPEYPAELRRLAASLGVEQRVIIEGRVRDERVQEVMRGARAFVLMSVCESFGIPTIEAMTFGTPVVASNCCAMPEVCGDAAELVPVDDVEALAIALHRTLTDEPTAERLRRAGAERVEHFRWSRTGERMAECFDELHLKQAVQQVNTSTSRED